MASISTPSAPRALYVGGRFKDEYRPDRCEHITVARNRPPEKIAADIQRRLAVVSGRLCGAGGEDQAAEMQSDPSTSGGGIDGVWVTKRAKWT